MKLIRRHLLVLLSLGGLHADPISLAPGSLLVASPTAAITTADVITYSKSGLILSQGQITGTGDLSESMTVLNGNLYVSDGAGRVNTIDLASGAVSSYFSTGMVGLDGLASLTGDLLALSFSSNAVDVYSTSGVLQRSITLASLPSNFSWSGLATDGSILYLDDATSGRIYEYSLSGVQLGSFPSGVLNTLIGLSYDASNHSLWITNSSFNGPSKVIDLSTTGTQLSQFSTGSFDPYGGIAVVPVNIPEPGSLGLLLLPAIVALAAGLSKFSPTLAPAGKERIDGPRKPAGGQSRCAHALPSHLARICSRLSKYWPTPAIRATSASSWNR
jgi:hypothetical protein